jgi:hypothetical protein
VAESRAKVRREWWAIGASLVAVLVSVASLYNSCEANKVGKKGYDLALHSAEPHFILDVEPLGPLRPGKVQIVAWLKNVGPVTANRVVAYGKWETFRAEPKAEQSFPMPQSGYRDLESNHQMQVPFGRELDLTEADVEDINRGFQALVIDIFAQRDVIFSQERAEPHFFKRTYNPKTGNWNREWPRPGERRQPS